MHEVQHRTVRTRDPILATSYYLVILIGPPQYLCTLTAEGTRATHMSARTATISARHGAQSCIGEENALAISPVATYQASADAVHLLPLTRSVAGLLTCRRGATN